MTRRTSMVAILVAGGIALASTTAPDPHEFGDEFASLEAREMLFDDALIELVSERTGVAAAQLSAAQLLGGTVTLEDIGEVDVTAVVVPMGDDESLGFVGVAVDGEGRVVQVALFGSTEFDDDRNGYWLAFCEQFEAPGAMSHVLDPSEALRLDEIESHSNAVFHGDLTSGVVKDATLYRHRYIMRENSARFTTLGMMRNRREAPTGDWLRDWAGNIGWLHTVAEEMEPLIGPEAVQVYKASAETGFTMLNDAAELADAGMSIGELGQSLRGLYKQSCLKCHRTKEHPLGDRTLYRDLRDRIVGDIRTDMGSVGMDVWGPRDGLRQVGRDAAARVRAALLLLGDDQD